MRGRTYLDVKLGEVRKKGGRGDRWGGKSRRS